MEISIVTTMYYSAPYLQEFYERISKSVKKITDDYEIIFVNDGSPDDSLDITLHLFENDEKVKIIDLSRNFGHHKALITGLSYACGEKIFLIDSDLEEEPELLELFYDRYIQEKDCDVVYGVQERRKGRFFERISGEIFYRFGNFISGFNMPRNTLIARLMSRRYVENLIQFTESELYIDGLYYLNGFKQIPVTVRKLFKGKTTYTLRKKVVMFINAITSLSNKPLLFIAYTGFCISSFTSIYILYLLINTIFFSKPIEGWTSLIVSTWFLSGIIILFLGLIGIYLSKIFIEIKNRPYTIIRDIYTHSSDKLKIQNTDQYEHK